MENLKKLTLSINEESQGHVESFLRRVFRKKLDTLESFKLFISPELYAEENIEDLCEMQNLKYLHLPSKFTHYLNQLQ